jgi:hypothetical protein
MGRCNSRGTAASEPFRLPVGSNAHPTCLRAQRTSEYTIVNEIRVTTVGQRPRICLEAFKLTKIVFEKRYIGDGHISESTLQQSPCLNPSLAASSICHRHSVPLLLLSPESLQANQTRLSTSSHHHIKETIFVSAKKRSFWAFVPE